MVEGLAGDVAVDECFGEALGKVGRARDVEGGPREREGLEAVAVEEDPGGSAAKFVAGAFDDVSAGGEPGGDGVLGVVDVGDVILA